MNLVIVESPTKAKTLGRFLGSDYQIEASMGHVRDLPENKLGIDVEHDFAPEYVVAEKKKDIVAGLHKAAKTAEKVILATDPDREGEAISWHIATLLDKVPTERITFHEITESAIKAALAAPGTINMQLVDAQQARRILDRLVGYKLSPLLWRKVRKGLSAGRVQSVAVRLIVEREREILAFKPEEYWEILAQFEGFTAGLVNVKIVTKDEADKIVAELTKAEFKVSDVATKEIKRSPYSPFTTSTLQQAAANLFGWTAKRTMQVAQNLYEQGLITYHRTDSTNLAAQAVEQVRKFIGDQYGEKYLPEGPRIYKTKSKVAQEAHEAIRPTQVSGSSDQGSDRDQQRLFELIWKRFVACQMSEALYEQTAVDITACLPAGRAGEYVFRANGNKQVFDGWQKLYEREEGVELPALTVGQILTLLGLVPSQHFTQPPPRFNEASLIKALEEFGIGRPSTYAPIISTIQDRQYVEKVDKKFQPTNLGFAVNDFLITNFPTIFEYQFTAKMEDELDEVANGTKQWVPVIKEFYDPFAKLLTKVGETAERVKVAVEETDEICPDDGGKLVVRIGRFGKFLACANFPKCKFTKPFAKKIDMKCPKCKEGDVIFRRTRSM
ncbi:type I DNA topoisomerase [Candidatus Microgenomates bacterium]|nr:type I DNA topoisomerase [Candidatus Microgenomates bacterium]